MTELREYWKMSKSEKEERIRDRNIIFINHLIEIVKADKGHDCFLSEAKARDVMDNIPATKGWTIHYTLIRPTQDYVEMIVKGTNNCDSNDDKLKTLVRFLQKQKKKGNPETRARECLERQYHAAVAFVNWYENEFGEITGMEFVEQR